MISAIEKKRAKKGELRVLIWRRRVIGNFNLSGRFGLFKKGKTERGNADIHGKSISSKGKSHCKSPEVGVHLAYSRNSKEACIFTLILKPHKDNTEKQNNNNKKKLPISKGSMSLMNIHAKS